VLIRWSGYYKEASREEAISHSGETVLKFLEAASEGDECSIQDYLSRNVDPCVRDSTGTTAVDRAIAKGHLHVLRVLIQAGVNINANKRDPWLHQAIRRMNFNAVDILLVAGANILAATIDGMTILEGIIVGGSTDAAALLRKHQAGTLAKLKPRVVQLYSR
jgi:hypothetical protein